MPARTLGERERESAKIKRFFFSDVSFVSPRKKNKQKNKRKKQKQKQKNYSLDVAVGQPQPLQIKQAQQPPRRVAPRVRRRERRVQHQRHQFFIVLDGGAGGHKVPRRPDEDDGSPGAVGALQAGLAGCETGGDGARVDAAGAGGREEA